MLGLANYLFYRNTVVITRGLQGSGKSSLAQELATLAAHSGLSVCIHETDSFFQTDEGYVFNPAMVGEYHKENYLAFQKSIDNGINVVIQSNTNVRHWEYEKYLSYAVENSYSTIIIDLHDNGMSNEELHSRQCHDFPLEKYNLLREGYQRIGAGVLT